jgi:hypothetical protein
VRHNGPGKASFQPFGVVGRGEAGVAGLNDGLFSLKFKSLSS